MLYEILDIRRLKPPVRYLPKQLIFFHFFKLSTILASVCEKQTTAFLLKFTVEEILNFKVQHIDYQLFKNQNTRVTLN